MKKLPTLYKKTSTGKIQEWTVGYKGDQVISIYGQSDGKKQTTSDTVTGKNVGKTNETSAEAQAKLKAKQLWDKKIKKRYVEKLDDAQEGTSSVEGIKPMLAFPIEKKEAHIVYPCIVQPKLDGMRCMAIITDEVKLYSRTGKPIVTLPHIEKELLEYFGDKKGRQLVLDGELYNHEAKDDFNKLLSLIKRDKPIEGYEFVQYHIYDVVSDSDYRTRMSVVYEMSRSAKYLRTLPNWIARNRQAIDKGFLKAIELGYEGAMYRNPNMGYDNTVERSTGLLKVKVFEDAEFKVIGVEEGSGKLQGSAGSIICLNEEGFEFKAKLKAYENSEGKRIESKEAYQKRCIDWLKNIEKYKGKMLTVQFQGRTPPRFDKKGKRIGGNVPRFPVAKRIRESE